MHFRPFLGAALSRANEIFSDGLQGWESLGTFSNEEWVVGSAFKLAWPPLYSAILRVFLISEEVALAHFSVLDLFLVTLKVPRKSGKKHGGEIAPLFSESWAVSSAC